MSLDIDLGVSLLFSGYPAAGGGAAEPNNDTHFSFTDFYVQPTGSNLNAGSTSSDAALATYVNSAVLGWNSGTGVFEVASGDPVADGVTVGMFGSVYVTAGATVATFVARVTAVSTTAVTVSLTAVSGTPPTTDTAGARTLKIGGAWAGPGGSVGFPYNFVYGSMMDSSNNIPHVNLKGGVDYSVTASVRRCYGSAWAAANAYVIGDVIVSSGTVYRCILGHTNQVPPNATYWVVVSLTISPVVFRGYTTTPRDNGQARIKGPTTGASFIVVSDLGSYTLHADIDVQDNGATGSASGFALSGSTNMAFGVSAHGMRGRGVELNNVLGALVECEAWGCNTSNTTYSGGIHAATAGSFVFRCMSHNNRGGSNGHGITMDTSIYWKECISAYNSGDGYQSNADTNVTLSSCDFYNNGANGLNFTGGSTTMLLSIVNCNFVKNGANGILFRRYGEIGEFAGNRFGAGTMANTTADATTFEPFSMSAANNSSYASDVTPWSDPDNGNLSITLAAAVGAGYGTYTAAFNGFGTNVSYPDVGAAEKSHA